MAEDKGLWYFAGKVRSAKETDKTWKRWRTKLDAIYKRIESLRAKQKKEMNILLEEQDEIFNSKPLTPWVGRSDEGALEMFLKSAITQHSIKDNYREQIRVLKTKLKKADAVTAIEIEKDLQQITSILRS
jgi:hypothetical protein